ncbi:MAG: hypothetical protein WBB62_18910 [Rhodococcus sp. (in: high G+C Gram-positive bacteria)]|jgi:molecular chaperone Hsp31 and glyoxalase 3
MTNALNFVKSLVGIAPKPDGEGFSPSTVALRIATKSTTDYDHASYPNALTDGAKVLMVCTEEQFMTM